MDKLVPRSLANIIGGRVRDLRRRRRSWSVERLADLLSTQCGITLGKARIYRTEQGVRQELTISEWLALAGVLGVPPIALLCPSSGEQQVVITPAITMTGRDLYAWLVGAWIAPAEVGVVPPTRAQVRAALHMWVPYAAEITGGIAQLDLDSEALYKVLATQYDVDDNN